MLLSEMKLFDVIVIIPPKVQKEDSAVEVIILFAYI
jgi:hypothetical protein